MHLLQYRVDFVPDVDHIGARKALKNANSTFHLRKEDRDISYLDCGLDGDALDTEQIWARRPFRRAVWKILAKIKGRLRSQTHRTEEFLKEPSVN
jgi:hypothetical protein